MIHEEQTSGPKVSVVTVVFNSADLLEATMQSVLEQTYPHTEYIVIDGGSVDGTLEIIHRYEARLEKWISEPDKGIYDAMNKGIALAQGDWICFLNSGDRFHTPQTLSQVFGNIEFDCEVVYGSCLIKYPKYSKLRLAKNINNLRLGLPSCHQGFFVRTSSASSIMFNLNEGLAADYGMICACYRNGGRFKKIPMIIADYSTGGISDMRRVEVYKSILRISHKYLKFRPWSSFYLMFLMMKEYLQSIIAKILGDRVVAKLRAIRHWQLKDIL